MSDILYPLENLVLPKTMGFVHYAGIDFHLSRDCDADDWPWGYTPAVNRMTSTPGGRWHGLTVFTREDVPETYLDIVVVHEVIEGRHLWYEHKEPEQAHALAQAFHMAYAKKYKDAQMFSNFLAWQQKFVSGN